MLLAVTLLACGKTSKEALTGQTEKQQPAEVTFNFETKTVMLNSGYEMPIYGLGTYSLTGETCVDSVTAALDSGVRLIDTAYMYQNEESVGGGGETFRHSKGGNFCHHKTVSQSVFNPEAAIEEALASWISDTLT